MLTFYSALTTSRYYVFVVYDKTAKKYKVMVWDQTTGKLVSTDVLGNAVRATLERTGTAVLTKDFKLAGVDLDVDSDRNGTVDDSGTEEQHEEDAIIYSGTWGALVLPNLDDDDSANGIDGNQSGIQGNADLLDMEQLVLQRKLGFDPTTIKWPWYLHIELVNPSGHPASPTLVNRLRVFASASSMGQPDFIARAHELLGPAHQNNQLPEGWLSTQSGPHVMAVEGLEPGAQVLVRLQLWDETKGVYGTNNAVLLSQDTVRIGVCPFLPIPSSQKTDLLYLGNNPVLNASLNAALGQVYPGSAAIGTRPMAYEFPQDPFESGYCRRPVTGGTAKTMRMVLGFPHASVPMQWVQNEFLGPNVAVYRGTGWGEAPGNMGGNYEVSPPFKITIQGKELRHDHGMTVVNTNGMTSAFRAFVKLQKSAGKSLLAVDATDLAGHSDELVSFIPTDDGKDFKVLLCNFDAALDLMAANPTSTLDVPNRIGIWTCEALREDYVVTNSALTARRKTILAEIRKLVRDTFGDTRVVELPVTPVAEMPVLQMGMPAWIYPIPNPINMLVLNQGNQTHVFVPKQWSQPFVDEVTRILRDEVGLAPDRIHFVDDSDANLHTGEVHCGSNAVRQAP